MANFTVKDPPEYNDEMRMLEPNDPGHANVFNPLIAQLLNNDAFLKAVTDLAEQHMKNGEIHVTNQDKEYWDRKAETTAATQSKPGLMSAGDKQKLDNVAANAEVNQNALSNIQVGSVTITANGKTSTFTMEAGDNVTLTADNATKKVIIKSNRDNGNADMLDGYHAEHFAAADHGHDGRYYTKAESDNQLKTKAAASHSHTKASIIDFPTSMPPTEHTHDGRYYTEAEVNNLLAGKAASSHSHNNYAKKAIYKDDGVSLERIGDVGSRSVALGAYIVKASGANSFAAGWGTEAAGDTSTVFGYSSKAFGLRSFAAGEGSKAAGYMNFVIGRYNLSRDTNPNEAFNDIFVIGNGDSDTVRLNLFRINNAGYVYCKGSYGSGGADYAEYYEWQDSNLIQEDRVGHFVTLDGNKIRIANQSDYILGIVSAFPCLIGNSDEEWQGRWKKDIFGRLIRKKVQVPITKTEEITEPVLDEDGNETGEVHVVGVHEFPTGEFRTEMQLEQVEGYDPTAVYIERKDRPEWAAIGMLGVLAVYDDGSCQVNGYCKVADGGIATAADGEYMLAEGKILRGYRVIERVADNIIKVIFR